MHFLAERFLFFWGWWSDLLWPIKCNQCCLLTRQHFFCLHICNMLCPP
jgi:hypothetical protein